MPTVLQIAKDAEKLVKKYNTRDPFVIAEAFGINIVRTDRTCQTISTQ